MPSSPHPFRVVMAFLLASFVASAAMAAKSVEILIEDDWTPYAFYSKDLGQGKKIQGISVDLISAALAESGYKVTFYPMPYARCLQLAMGEKHIACFNAIADRALEVNYLFPKEPLIRADHKIFSLKKNPARNLTLKDLDNKQVGLVHGYTYGEAFEKARKIKKEYAPTEISNLLKLAQGRVDFIIMEEASANYYIRRNKELKNKLKVAGSIGFIEITGAFSKVHPRSPEIINALDHGLRVIKKDERYKQIYDKWLNDGEGT